MLSGRSSLRGGTRLDWWGKIQMKSAQSACFHLLVCGLLVCGAVIASAGGAAFGGILSEDRATTWKPGLMATGSIPERTTVCATLTPRGSSLDDAEQIQSAIDACPEGQVVQLAEGTFIINGGAYLLINKGVTLRGAGPERTTLEKTDGAKVFTESVGENPTPLVIIGPARYSPIGSSSTDASATLTTSAEKGSLHIQVDDPSLFSPGQFVLLDEASGARWQADPQGRGKIWASPDWRVVWQKHNPAVDFVDDFDAETFPATPESAGSWFSRADRPTAEIKQISAISGSTIHFTTPIHISYRVANNAQLSRYAIDHVVHAGVEDLKIIGGDNGNLRFHWAAYSWTRNVDITRWHGEGISIENSFGIELREFYVHDAAWAQPGGGGYGISLTAGSSEILIENGIVVRTNKLIVSRAAGAGSVVGYNYMDMSYINTYGSWIEIGLNASHMVGSHHVLLEGNYSHNADSDKTHGNSIYLTFLRNYFRGVRARFENQAGGIIDDARQPENGPKRCAGAAAYSYWMSFVGNVLGAPGEMDGWRYESSSMTVAAIWLLGWDDVAPYPADPMVARTALRHGNFDYVTNTVTWHPGVADHDLPNSLYLDAKPAFFNAGRGYAWPWVTPEATTKTHTLPAKARYDAGTPFMQP